MENRLSFSNPVITLLTDFGTQDYFVAAMKGMILSINPTANIVDISHDIPPQDIQAAALSNGIAAEELGDPLIDIVRLEAIDPKWIDPNTIQGRIIHIDHFGNCVTTFSRADLALGKVAHSWKLLVNDREINSFRDFFS